VRLEKIDPAIASVRTDLIASSKLTQTYGLAFLVGGVQDILGEFLGNAAFNIYKPRYLTLIRTGEGRKKPRNF
jgi:hypothetical protein